MKRGSCVAELLLFIVMLLLLCGNCRGSWTVVSCCAIALPDPTGPPPTTQFKVVVVVIFAHKEKGRSYPVDVIILETLMFCPTVSGTTKFRLVKKARPEKPIGHCCHC